MFSLTPSIEQAAMAKNNEMRMGNCRHEISHTSHISKRNSDDEQVNNIGSAVSSKKELTNIVINGEVLNFDREIAYNNLYKSMNPSCFAAPISTSLDMTFLDIQAKKEKPMSIGIFLPTCDETKEESTGFDYDDNNNDNSSISDETSHWETATYTPYDTPFGSPLDTPVTPGSTTASTAMCIFDFDTEPVRHSPDNNNNGSHAYGYFNTNTYLSNLNEETAIDIQSHDNNNNNNTNHNINSSSGNSTQTIKNVDNYVTRYYDIGTQTSDRTARDHKSPNCNCPNATERLSESQLKMCETNVTTVANNSNSRITFGDSEDYIGIDEDTFRYFQQCEMVRNEMAYYCSWLVTNEFNPRVFNFGLFPYPIKLENLYNRGILNRNQVLLIRDIESENELLQLMNFSKNEWFAVAWPWFFDENTFEWHLWAKAIKIIEIQNLNHLKTFPNVIIDNDLKYVYKCFKTNEFRSVVFK